MIIGATLGGLAGFYGGWLDILLMRLADIVVAFPFFVLVIAIVAVLGPGLTNMYIAVAIVGWTAYARLIRSEVLVAKQADYVNAARVLGYGDGRILIRHLLPNVAGQAIVFATSDFVLDILLGSSLGFLGLGSAGARSGVGGDDRGRSRLHRPGALDNGLPGAGDRDRRARVQPSRRRTG